MLSTDTTNPLDGFVLEPPATVRVPARDLRPGYQAVLYNTDHDILVVHEVEVATAWSDGVTTVELRGEAAPRWFRSDIEVRVLASDIAGF